MAKKNGFTKQGVRNLNALGGRHVNGRKIADCKHHHWDIFVSDVEYAGDDEMEEPILCNILSCERCGEVLGPEAQFDVTSPEYYPNDAA